MFEEYEYWSIDEGKLKDTIGDNIIEVQVEYHRHKQIRRIIAYHYWGDKK